MFIFFIKNDKKDKKELIYNTNMEITYKDTLINIIGFNNTLLKLKCEPSDNSHRSEVKFIRNIMKKSVEYALLYKPTTYKELQQIK